MGGVPPADRLYVSVGISRAVAFTEADRTLLRNLLSLGLVSAVALGVAAIVGHLLIIRRLREVVRTAADGSYSLRLVPSRRGTFRYRVYMPSCCDGRFVGTTSRILVITVR